MKMSNTEIVHGPDMKEELTRRGFVKYTKRILGNDRYIEGFSMPQGNLVTHCKSVSLSVWTVQLGASGEVQSFFNGNNALNYIDRVIGKIDEITILEEKYKLLELRSQAIEEVLKQKISALGQQMARLESVVSKLKLL